MTDYMWAKPENVQKLMDKYLKEQKDKLIAEFLKDIDTIDNLFGKESITVFNIREKWEKRII